MVDTKISALPVATTPLAGTELIPVVQAGVTKRVPVSGLPGGGGGSPGGSSGQLQYNNAGALGGMSDALWDAANSRVSFGAGASPQGKAHVRSGAASEIGMIVQGATSQTANLQQWRNSAGSVLSSINASGEYSIGSTALSSANGVQVLAAGEPLCQFGRRGFSDRTAYAGSGITGGGTSSAPVDFTINMQLMGQDLPTRALRITGQHARATATTNLVGGNLVFISGDGASSSSGAAHGGHIYLDAGRGFGTGVDGDVIVGATRGVLRLPVRTVATLPSAATAGRRCFVSDANATTFNSVVAGGGANFVPVFSDGANWRIG